MLVREPFENLVGLLGGHFRDFVSKLVIGLGQIKVPHQALPLPIEAAKAGSGVLGPDASS